MSAPETFANKLLMLMNDASRETPKVEILKALDDQRVNVLRWIETERRNTDEYLSTRKP